MISKKLFDVYQGKNVYVYTLRNGGIEAGILDFGGILNYLKVNGVNVCLGYDNIESYLSSRSYCGATVGRVANRIKNSKFSLNGKQCKLVSNEGSTCLHGGVTGFDKRFFDAEISGETLKLSLISEDGDMGFVGRLNFKVEFTVSENSLNIKYTGISNKDTVFSPTCHAYFNLNGYGGVLDNELFINADSFTPTDENLIPLGNIQSVKGTPLDFTVLKPIGKDISLLNGKTYDHNFCLKSNRAATAKSELTGIEMNVYTDMSGIQFYVGECKKINGKGGGFGFCLEPQFYPNAINTAGFTPPLLPAYTEKTYFVEYSFTY